MGTGCPRYGGRLIPPLACSPANFLEEEGNRGLVAAVFGILFSSLCVLVLDRDPLPLITDSSQGTRGKASTLLAGGHPVPPHQGGVQLWMASPKQTVHSGPY